MSEIKITIDGEEAKIEEIPGSVHLPFLYNDSIIGSIKRENIPLTGVTQISIRGAEYED